MGPIMSIMGLIILTRAFQFEMANEAEETFTTKMLTPTYLPLVLKK